ncbi:ACT domain-containing protein [Scardovia wiggsiae]|uniref:ACT domain-containing protein n=1 Tax=Scardovia wiggsiae TaxID=230143 RepID=UPI001CAA9326|nr:ACT domain-containing protein [Scardovia wiggsiae]
MSGGSLGDIFPDLQGPESPVISGVAHDSSEALVTLRGILDEPGLAAHVFAQFAKAGVNIDMVVQALGRNDNGSRTADISITFPEAQIGTVRELAESAKGQLGYSSADVNPSVGKVSLIGVGMKTHPGVTAQFFEALSREGINVLMISTSEIRISAIIPLDMLARGVRAVHTAFGLDSEGTQAIVYAGSGR